MLFSKQGNMEFFDIYAMEINGTCLSIYLSIYLYIYIFISVYNFEFQSYVFKGILNLILRELYSDVFHLWLAAYGGKLLCSRNGQQKTFPSSLSSYWLVEIKAVDLHAIFVGCFLHWSAMWLGMVSCDRYLSLHISSVIHLSLLYVSLLCLPL